MSEEKKPERYNTVFLVSQIQETQSRNKKIGIAVAVVIGLVIVYALFIRTPAPDTEGMHATPPSATAAPAAPTPPPTPVPEAPVTAPKK